VHNSLCALTKCNKSVLVALETELSKEYSTLLKRHTVFNTEEAMELGVDGFFTEKWVTRYHKYN
jgi:hypothetical protein